MRRWLRPIAVAGLVLTLAGCKLLFGGTTNAGIFVVDSGNDRIVNVTDMACSNWATTSAPASFAAPYGIGIDSAGLLYASDQGSNDRIARMDNLTGVGFLTFGTTGTGTNQFNNPAGLRVDISGQVFVADSLNNRVVSFLWGGALWTAYKPTGGDALNTPMGVGWDNNTGTSDRKIYILDSGNSKIVRVDSLATGANRAVFGGFGAGVGQFNLPMGLYLQSGVIYVADTGNNRIVSFNFSEFGNPAPPSWTEYNGIGSGIGGLTSPDGIYIPVVSSQMYVADTGNHRIVRVDLPLTAAGTNPATCGTPGAGVGQFNSPTSIIFR